MIREIEKPNIEFKFGLSDLDKFYYNNETNEYFHKNKFNDKYYFNLNGEIHRVNKPAIEFSYGIKAWKENNFLHRLDGPAYEKSDIFWIKGNNFSAANFALKTDHLICLVCNKFCNQGCFL